MLLHQLHILRYLIYLYKEQYLELSRTCKLDWLNEDIQKLISLTFNPNSVFWELERTLSKAQENDLLLRLNKIVEIISKREEINSTLFFSKKVQKDFLRLVCLQGVDTACREITSWREKLIKDELLNLLK